MMIKVEECYKDDLLEGYSAFDNETSTFGFGKTEREAVKNLKERMLERMSKLSSSINKLNIYLETLE